MSVPEAIQPYMKRAEDDCEALVQLCDQIHDVVVSTAEKVATNQGESQYLLDALEGVVAAHVAFQRGVEGLCTSAQDAVAA